MIIPTIITEAVQGLEQCLDEFTILGPRYKHLRNIDRFYIRKLLDYVRNATEDDRCAVARLLHLNE